MKISFSFYVFCSPVCLFVCFGILQVEKWLAQENVKIAKSEKKNKQDKNSFTLDRTWSDKSD